MLQFNNYTTPNPNAVILFLDMNSFFASCEQQENPDLRGKPIGVGSTGNNGVIIAPSIEAKKFGVKTGMRFNDAKLLCPQLIGVNTHSAIYRKYHIGVMDVLRSYSQDVIPKSIDEAVVNLTAYKYVYPDIDKLARDIKKDINTKVGDWLKCSIGIAPNTFLAKLATGLQKPDGLVHINKDNIDDVLSKLSLTDLPGIADRMSYRLIRAGIKTPLELRHTSPEVLKKIMGGIVGYYWHYRLNFSEVDFYTSGYKSMSAVRTLSGQQRANIATLNDILVALCMKLENRLVQHHVFCKDLTFMCSYMNRGEWSTHIRMQTPLQDGTDMLHCIQKRIVEFEHEHNCKIINNDLRTIGVAVNDFISDKYVQYELFDNKIRKDKLRRAVYDIKDHFGKSKIIKAIEMRSVDNVRDVIGFGSVKDMYK
jgi:DNA polymerase-4